MPYTKRLTLSPDLYFKSLLFITVGVIIISCIMTIYEINIPLLLIIKWICTSISEISVVKKSLYNIQYLAGYAGEKVQLYNSDNESFQSINEGYFEIKYNEGLPVLTKEQLNLFDGSRPSKPTCLAILGRIYDVSRGSKHYSPGGAYHSLAGKDATRAFVTGDFSEEGLVDNLDGLNDQDLLSIYDWIKFYEKEYKLVGYLQGTYYTSTGELTEEGEKSKLRLEKALHFRVTQVEEYEVFPPCNSEFHQNNGGKVWCTNRSGGIKREWAGVPRKLFQPSSKSFRCACVKNFGDPLSTPGVKGNRGDLDYPNLGEYESCSSTSNSCRL
ncbi:Neuferricin [Strongyloides ratti]|uniref:Neuferricin n=1 Tax=Strongyloides ratti TaxID=34506 RepID=A0A090L6G4_STRRB|nr:Neuferricin [Strongyloides ratti]CEF65327.1 Neuferricin [Strongyloides ratti]